MKHIIHRSVPAALVLGLTLSAFQVRAQMVSLYVGIDSRATLPSGVYAGQPNPNAGRLSLLYAHTYRYGELHRSHYHMIGGHSYTGDPTSPEIRDTSVGNSIPEVNTGLPGLQLVADAGWPGKLISRETQELYSDLRFRSVHSLASFGLGSSEHFMFHSSGGTRTASLDGATLALELIGKSEGLNIADVEGNAILTNAGDQQIIGAGDDPTFEYRPVFWVDEDAAPGEYHAELRLVDLNDSEGRVPFPASGRFFLRFRVAEAPVLEIARTITLTLPLVTDGWELAAAPGVEGPWTVVPFPAAPDTRYGQTGTTYEATFPLSADRQFYQLRPATASAN
jgi:hypothetical protein